MPRRRVPSMRDRYVAGLEFLGFVSVPTTAHRFLVYRRPGGDRNWYLGAAGSMRVGKSLAASHATSTVTKQYVLTAPAIRPRVYELLSHVDPSRRQAAELAHTLQDEDADLAAIPLRIVLTHVLTWQKRQDREAA